MENNADDGWKNGIKKAIEMNAPVINAALTAPDSECQTSIAKLCAEDPEVPAKSARCIHKLKTWPRFFKAVSDGVKTFELRKDDRNFQVGDELLLQEFDPDRGYSGRELRRIVVYKLDANSFSGVEKGYCILGLGMLRQECTTEGQKTPTNVSGRMVGNSDGYDTEGYSCF